MRWITDRYIDFKQLLTIHFYTCVMENNPELPSMSEQPYPRSKNRISPLLIIAGFVGIVIVLFLILKDTGSTIGSTVLHTAKNTKISPTPMPFQEMTIPYLRERKYESKLGARELYEQSSNYTAYLTSYTSDGLSINGLLTIPSGTMPEGGWPAIVFIHGYIPPTQYATTEKYVDYVDYLARNGFVVFKIDLRGHGNSEGEAGGGYFGSDYVVDALNAYTALQSADFVNANRIGMWGHSMAGNVVLRSMAARPEIPAAVIWAGAVYSYEDMQKYGISDSSYRPPSLDSQRLNRRRALFEKVGSPSASSPFWQIVAPTNYLDDLKGAIEINHAEDDDVVNIGYSRDLMEMLDKTSIPHEFFTYPTGGHNISEPSFSLAMQRTVDFFKTYLTK